MDPEEIVDVTLFLHVVEEFEDEDGAGGKLSHHEFTMPLPRRLAAPVVEAFFSNPEGNTSVHEDTLRLFPQP